MRFLKVSEKKFPKNTQFTGSQQVAKFMDDVKSLDREALWILHLDTRLNLIDRELVSLGIVSGSLCHPREVFRRAIIQGSTAIILVHNHPTGDPSPSADDHNVTEKIKEASNILQIDFLDHIIIGPTDKYFSFADDGKLNP